MLIQNEALRWRRDSTYHTSDVDCIESQPGMVAHCREDNSKPEQGWLNIKDSMYVTRDESRQRPLQVFAPISLERSQARHDCSRGSEPVKWIGYNFCTRSLLLYDVISDVVFTNSLR